MSKTWATGSTTAWRKTRREVLRKYGYRCQLHLDPWGPGPAERCQGRADCVHHVLGRAVTGDDPMYLTASCTPCNTRLGEPTKIEDAKTFKGVTKW